MSEYPVSLVDADGRYNNLVYTEVVPKLLEVIQESGLSYSDAKSVPKALEVAINLVCDDALATRRFMAKNV